MLITKAHIIKKSSWLPVLLLLLLNTNHLYAVTLSDTCNVQIKGQVIDAETKEPLPYALVNNPENKKGAVTDSEGKFIIRGLCSLNTGITCSYMGYYPATLDLNNKNSENLIIQLRPKASTLDEISFQSAEVKGAETLPKNTLKKEDINADPTQSLGKTISSIEGVTYTSTGTNVQLPVIHGLYGNRVLILNDNLRHGYQNWGSDHAPEIDLSGAYSITVVKGALGARYGPEAMGGAIIIENDPLRLNTPFNINAGTGFQTNGRGFFSTLKASKGFGRWSYFLGGKHTVIGDRHSPDYILTNSGKKETAVNTGIRYFLPDWDFKVYYSYLDQNLALLRSSVAESGNLFVRSVNAEEPLIIEPFSYAINKPNQKTKHHFARTEISWWYSDSGKLTLRAGTQLNKREEYDIRRNADKPIIDLDLTTNEVQLEWHHPTWKGLSGQAGIQLFRQNNQNNPGTGTTPFIPNYNSTRYSAFIVENLQQGRNTYELGIRFDQEHSSVAGRNFYQDVFTDSFNWNSFTSSLGFIRKISESVTFRTNIGNGWRRPDMAELYSYGQHGFKASFGLLRYYTNEHGELRTDEVLQADTSQILPERGYKWVNDLSISSENNTCTFTAYTHLMKNYIYSRPVAVTGTVRGPVPVFIYEQTDALLIGADIMWKHRLSENIHGRWGAGYIRARNIQNNSPLLNQPPASTSYKLSYISKSIWNFDHFILTLNPSYTFKQFQAPRTIPPEQLVNRTAGLTYKSEIFDFKDAPKGYFLFNVSCSVKTGNFKWKVEVRNLLNQRFRSWLNHMRYFADEMGRNILFTINYSLNRKRT